MKRKSTFLAAFVSLFMMNSNAYSQNHLCVQNPSGEAHLVTFDISNGALIDSIGVQFTNIMETVDGFTGMSQDPISGLLYVTLKDGNSDKRLGTIDPVTGDITSIGVLSFNSSSIAFDAAGTLYGMDGNGSTTLYTINTSDATSTSFYDFTSAGQDGEAIVVNTTDGLLYRYDGSSNGDLITLNLTSLVETTIASFSNTDDYGGAFYYNSSTNDFTFAIGETFYNVTTAGVITELSDMAGLGWSGNFKGIHKINYAGIQENGQDVSEYTVYPNPSNGSFNIDTDKEFELEVIDVNGAIIQKHTNVKSINIELSGVYFLKFIEVNGITVRKVVIK